MHQIDNGIKENFFQWNGRLNRKRYIKRLLALGAFSVVAYLVLGFLALALGDPSMQPDESTALGIFGLLQLLRIPITISGYMLMIRRLHDVGVLCAAVPRPPHQSRPGSLPAFQAGHTG